MRHRFWQLPVDLWRYRRYRRAILLIQMNMRFNDPVSFEEWRGCYLNPRHQHYLLPFMPVIPLTATSLDDIGQPMVEKTKEELYADYPARKDPR